MKIALFYNPNSNAPYVGDELTEKYCTDMARTTEWVEVEFPPLPAEARQEQMSRIELARKEALKHYEQTLARINQQAEALS